MIAAIESYETGLRQGWARLLVDEGRDVVWPIGDWGGEPSIGDSALIHQCVGPTLDVGCGPGRLTAALLARGVPALGIAVSPLAVRLGRNRGGLALIRGVFAPIPGSGRWEHLLLADGNIGIGGHPVRLLQRCRELLARGGTVHLDLEAPGSGLLIQTVRLDSGSRLSPSFRWCWLGIDALPHVAGAAGLAVMDSWSVAGRWQAIVGRPG